MPMGQGLPCPYQRLAALGAELGLGADLVATPRARSGQPGSALPAEFLP